MSNQDQCKDQEDKNTLVTHEKPYKAETKTARTHEQYLELTVCNHMRSTIHIKTHSLTQHKTHACMCVCLPVFPAAALSVCLLVSLSFEAVISCGKAEFM